MEEKKSNSKINSLNKMKFYYDKLKEYDPTFLTNVQKEVILNSLEFIIEKQNVNNYQLNEFFKLLTQRVKTGFVFDEIPKSFNGFISIPKEIKKKEMKSFCGSDEKENINHFLFIGENYDVLKNLLITHKEKIDVIYIDPPYNTDSANSEGNFLSEEQEKNISKFIYRDRFSRTGWLNMMKERLILAKDLLSKNGIIFVSIDDNEQAYLKVLMDEIFDEMNFISNIIFDKRNAQNDAKYIQRNHEYILTYCKNITLFSGFNKEVTKREKTIPTEITIGGTEGFLYHRKNLGSEIFYNPILNKIKVFDDYIKENLSINSGYEIYVNTKEKEDLIKHNYVRIRPPLDKTGKIKRWTYTKEKIINEFNSGKLIFEKGKNNMYVPKAYPKNNDFKILPPKSITNNISNNGTRTLTSLGLRFDNSKSLDLIKYLINLIPNKDALILDFFSGSGTTGHAVMKLNEKDNGQRKFILATNNENNIAQDITYERLYRIIKGNSTNGHNDFEWINNNRPFTNNNLKVFELNEIKVTPDQKLFDLSSEIINEYKKIDPSLKLNNKSDIFFKLSSLEQRIDLGKENEINK